MPDFLSYRGIKLFRWHSRGNYLGYCKYFCDYAICISSLAWVWVLFHEEKHTADLGQQCKGYKQWTQSGTLWQPNWNQVVGCNQKLLCECSPRGTNAASTEDDPGYQMMFQGALRVPWLMVEGCTSFKHGKQGYLPYFGQHPQRNK